MLGYLSFMDTKMPSDSMNMPLALHARLLVSVSMLYAEHNMTFLCDIKLLTASTNILCTWNHSNSAKYVPPDCFFGIHILSSILAGALPRTLVGKLKSLRQTPCVFGLKGGGFPRFICHIVDDFGVDARCPRVSRSENFLNEALSAEP